MSLFGNFAWFSASLNLAEVTGLQDPGKHHRSHVGWTWQLGRVQLVSDSKSFRAAFARFVHNDENGFSEDKFAHRGEECRVTEVHYDHTVLCTFDDQTSFIVPFEAIQRQVNVIQLHLNVNPVRFGIVQLLADEQAFRHAFARFEGDPDNGFSGAKLAHRGQTCGVMKLTPERTLSCLLHNSKVLDFPWEVVAKQVEVADFAVDPVRRGHVLLWRDIVPFKRAFNRMHGDKKLHYTAAKLTRAGQTCHVTHVYVTRTFRCTFDDDEELKLPWEAVEQTIDSEGNEREDNDDEEVREDDDVEVIESSEGDEEEDESNDQEEDDADEEDEHHEEGSEGEHDDSEGGDDSENTQHHEEGGESKHEDGHTADDEHHAEGGENKHRPDEGGQDHEHQEETDAHDDHEGSHEDGHHEQGGESDPVDTDEILENVHV